MGFKYFSSSSFDEGRANIQNVEKIKERFVPVPIPNPDPSNYHIMAHETVGDLLLVHIQYHDCTNFEGRKILIFECTLEELKEQGEIDPHFSDSEKMHSPIARFRPTAKGWEDAKTFANHR